MNNYLHKQTNIFTQKTVRILYCYFMAIIGMTLRMS